MLYVCWFTGHNQFNDFRRSELVSLAEGQGVNVSDLWVTEHPNFIDIQNFSPKYTGDEESCFVVVSLPGDQVARNILNRSVLLKGIVELWAEGESLETVKSQLSSASSYEFRRLHIDGMKTFAFRCVAFGKHMSQQEQVDKMNKFSFLFKGTETVNLSNPDLMLFIGEFWDQKSRKGATEASTPDYLYFGRVVATRNKDFFPLYKYRLSERPVLGPTTLDTELAFLMVNQAHVSSGHIVLDPFVGTGALLIAAAQFGAIPVGSDIDMRVLKGWRVAYIRADVPRDNETRQMIKKSKPKIPFKKFKCSDGSQQNCSAVDKVSGSSEPSGGVNYTNVFTNFKHYGLVRPEIVRVDNGSPCWRSNLLRRSKLSNCDSVNCGNKSSDEHISAAAATGAAVPWIDAIVTDPPYGIRAASRQSKQSECNKEIECHPIGADSEEGEPVEEYVRSGPPTTQLYPLDDMLHDLITLASEVIVDGGYFVFLLPLKLSSIEDRILELKGLKDFELKSTSLQHLTAGRGRLLVAMKRVPRIKI